LGGEIGMSRYSEFWSDERVAMLEWLSSSGWSARQIAEKIGCGCSRNAVIGKAYRLGLSKPTKSSITRRARSGKATTMHHLVNPARRDPLADPLTLLELDGRTCKWPLWAHDGTGERVFCGARSDPGKVYCNAHHERAYAREPGQRYTTKRSALTGGLAA